MENSVVFGMYIYIPGWSTSNYVARQFVRRREVAWNPEVPSNACVAVLANPRPVASRTSGEEKLMTAVGAESVGTVYK